MKKTERFNFNFKPYFIKPCIQFFAEGNEGKEDNGGNEGGAPTPKTYSEEEYAKLKNSFDKTASELAELKKQLKSKMTEDEKKSEEQKEIDKKLKLYESKMEDYELKDELVAVNVFTNDEIQTIISKKESKKDLIKSIVELVNGKIEEAKKQAVAEFMRSSDGSGGTGGNEKKIDKELQDFIDKNKTGYSTKARDYYLNKNKK